ncbi:hypothetical protein BDZ94DRAFT_161269 [Collybia nuda]|uniref:DUF6533 domain-containing protein n=1 Tax=Collybia nuda TaxID=64659 RepID=A0A9P5XW59_9AGAR|nr:hypothetical protein BDZ94DRAFT_161269 [Collybia nuda]
MANLSNVPLPNSSTPLAFLPPDQAYQKAIMDYVGIGGLSVLVWDILTHLHSDYKLITQHRIKLPTIVYLISRWCTLLYVITGSLFHTAPIDDCNALIKVSCAVYHITVSSTALLFLFRVRAVFKRNIYITSGFFGLWVAVLGGSLMSVLSATGKHINGTKYCAFSNPKPYRSAIANIIIAIFDTCVFIAITWRLSNQLPILKNDNLHSKSHIYLFGKYLPTFSNSLLRDGEKYYMVTMVVNLLVVILNFAPRVPMTYRSTFLSPAVGLTNIMACRVFRHTKMRRKYDVNVCPADVSTIVFRKGDIQKPIGLYIALIPLKK